MQIKETSEAFYKQQEALREERREERRERREERREERRRDSEGVWQRLVRWLSGQ